MSPQLVQQSLIPGGLYPSGDDTITDSSLQTVELWRRCGQLLPQVSDDADAPFAVISIPVDDQHAVKS